MPPSVAFKYTRLRVTVHMPDFAVAWPGKSGPNAPSPHMLGTVSLRAHASRALLGHQVSASGASSIHPWPSVECARGMREKSGPPRWWALCGKLPTLLVLVWCLLRQRDCISNALHLMICINTGHNTAVLAAPCQVASRRSCGRGYGTYTKTHET